MNGSSEIPQWAPRIKTSPEQGNSAGLIPVSVNKEAKASSWVEGRSAAYAVDNTLRTWWQASSEDSQPWIEVDLYGQFRISAVRVMWAEPCLDYDNGIVPGPFGYYVEIANKDDEWTRALDRTENTMDMLIDYQVFEPSIAKRARLVVTKHPPGIEVGMLSLTYFGEGLNT